MDVFGGGHQDGGRVGGADLFFLSAAAAVTVPRTVDAVASASVNVSGTSVRLMRHVGVPAMVASLHVHTGAEHRPGNRIAGWLGR